MSAVLCCCFENLYIYILFGKCLEMMIKSFFFFFCLGLGTPAQLTLLSWPKWSCEPLLYLLRIFRGFSHVATLFSIEVWQRRHLFLKCEDEEMLVFAFKWRESKWVANVWHVTCWKWSAYGNPAEFLVGIWRMSACHVHRVYHRLSPLRYRNGVWGRKASSAVRALMVEVRSQAPLNFRAFTVSIYPLSHSPLCCTSAPVPPSLVWAAVRAHTAVSWFQQCSSHCYDPWLTTNIKHVWYWWNPHYHVIFSRELPFATRNPPHTTDKKWCDQNSYHNCVWNCTV